MVDDLRTIGAGEFKARCLALLDEVAAGHQVIVVTKRGKPVARVAPVAAAEADLRKRLRGSIVRESDLVSPIDAAWNAAS
jgi:prevent-host-death family protein